MPHTFQDHGFIRSLRRRRLKPCVWNFLPSSISVSSWDVSGSRNYRLCLYFLQSIRELITRTLKLRTQLSGTFSFIVFSGCVLGSHQCSWSYLCRPPDALASLCCRETAPSRGYTLHFTSPRCLCTLPLMFAHPSSKLIKSVHAPNLQVSLLTSHILSHSSQPGATVCCRQNQLKQAGTVE